VGFQCFFEVWHSSGNINTQEAMLRDPDDISKLISRMRLTKDEEMSLRLCSFSFSPSAGCRSASPPHLQVSRHRHFPSPRHLPETASPQIREFMAYSSDATEQVSRLKDVLYVPSILHEFIPMNGISSVVKLHSATNATWR